MSLSETFFVSKRLFYKYVHTHTHAHTQRAYSAQVRLKKKKTVFAMTEHNILKMYTSSFLTFWVKSIWQIILQGKYFANIYALLPVVVHVLAKI